MSILELDDDTLQIETVRCSDSELTVTLKDGRRIAVPLWWLPRLHRATPKERAGWRIMPFGDAVEWEAIGPARRRRSGSRTPPWPGASAAPTVS